MPKRRVLLLGWDAADWRVIQPLIDGGHMPNLARLVERGVMGNLATLQPILSPMLWTSIGTGKRPSKHGVHGFAEITPGTGEVRPISSRSRTTKAVWNILHQEGKACHVVGWWPSNPAEPLRGAMVSDFYQKATAPLGKPWPLPTGCIHPRELVAELAPLRVHPRELEGDMLRAFVPRAPEIDQTKDKRLGVLANIIAECASVQAAATHILATRRDWDFCAVYQDAIDHFCHGFMRYHPPRLDWVPAEDFTMYSQVVGGAYVFHDTMLGVLLELAGDDVTVLLVSDHGFHSDHLRPRDLPNEPAGPAAEHRPYGIFVAAGPGIRSDELLFGGSILDVTPTVLTLFDLPVGRDMDGRPLTQIFTQPPQVALIDSWDAVPGDAARLDETEATGTDPEATAAVVQQLADLGYIDPLPEDKQQGIEQTVRENRWNLARALADEGRLEEAVEMLTSLWDRWPAEGRFGVAIIRHELELGHVAAAHAAFTLLGERKAAAMKQAATDLAGRWAGIREAQGLPQAGEGALDEGVDLDRLSENDRRTLRQLRGKATLNPRSLAVVEGKILAAERRYHDALAAFERAEGVQESQQAALVLERAEVLLAMRKMIAAEAEFARVLRLDPLNVAARYGLARTALARNEPARAAEEARAAIGLRYHAPRVHLLAGVASWRAGDLGEAERWLRSAVAQQPVFPAAHRLLAAFLGKVRGDYAAAVHHRRLAKEAQALIRRPRAGVSPEERRTFELQATGGGDAGTPAAGPACRPEDCVVIVTGLPRSGTSMMMQMLAAGGIPLLTDGERPSDESNPRGYFEYDPVKRLAADRSWVATARGKAVKVVSPLLCHLPRGPAAPSYVVVHMLRPVAEVVASQRTMITRLGKAASETTDEALVAAFEHELVRARTALGQLAAGGTQTIEIAYHDCLADPLNAARRLGVALGPGFDATAAAAAVDPTLHRAGRQVAAGDEP